VTFLPLPQPKLVLDLATPEGCKAELTCRAFQVRTLASGNAQSPSVVHREVDTSNVNVDPEQSRRRDLTLDVRWSVVVWLDFVLERWNSLEVISATINVCNLLHIRKTSRYSQLFSSSGL